MKRATKSLLVASVLCAWLLAGCAESASNAGDSAGSITIGSKNFTENIILAHMMAILIEENADIAVTRKVNLGGSNVAWQALLSNEIQLYPEYTGTIVANYYQEETGTSEETLSKARELVQQDQLKFLEPWGFNNTYTLALKEEKADELGVKTYSDLAKVSHQLVIGSEFEFLDRPDGLPGLKETYNMQFAGEKGMDAGIRYRSIEEGEVDVINAYATDGMLKVYNLKILEDDKSFFPPYDMAPLIRQETIQQFPVIEDLLNQLAGKISDETMQELNALVDSQGMKEETVARNFLEEQGLIQ
ncbi:glycine betaine ABC transporter substrate-binding protein [Brevibacillus marinus]|uniref:glycine betaine ABC transporter substrate-binding protein n=1 Tax=Brevibacillus marinus TaxID=2496837 RepID=UPI000F84650C|nr:glycine betaine ABC transporter substrate-binding protein [Brevibacillus marinus]